MGRLIFLLKEGFGGLFRARFASMVAVATVAISLVLIGFFLVVTINLGRLFENLRSRVELEVFLDDSFDSLRIEELEEQIQRFEGVETVTFISKEQAVAEFKQLFQGQEEDYFETLGFNPLPASFRIKLTESYRSSTGAEKVFRYLSTLDGIREEDIVYRREFLVLLEKYFEIALVVDLVIGAIVCLSALLLVSNNVRLIILSKQKVIETMKLVGATQRFIRIPLFIQGVTQGFIGGLFAALFLYGLIKLAAVELPGYVKVSWELYPLLVLSGGLLGLAGSYSAVRRHL